MGTLEHCFDSSSRSVSPRRCSASSRSFCSRSECSCRSRARNVADVFVSHKLEQLIQLGRVFSPYE